MNNQAKANRDSLTGFAERELRQAILMGRFTPGTRLNIRELSELLGTSATPIREALMRLSAQRILQAKPGQFSIPLISRERYLEITTIRLIVETAAAEYAAAKISAEQLKTVIELGEQYKEAVRGREYQLAVELNARFKFAVFEASAMPTLTAIIEDLMLQVAPLFIHSVNPGPDTPAWVEINVHYTEQIMLGLSEHDAQRVQHAIKGLIMMATEKILPTLKD